MCLNNKLFYKEILNNKLCCKELNKVNRINTSNLNNKILSINFCYLNNQVSLISHNNYNNKIRINNSYLNNIVYNMAHKKVSNISTKYLINKLYNKEQLSINLLHLINNLSLNLLSKELYHNKLSFNHIKDKDIKDKPKSQFFLIENRRVCSTNKVIEQKKRIKINLIK